MNLYQYQKAQIKAGLSDVLDSFREADLSWMEQAQIASAMKFRDRAGRYWAADIYQGDFYFYDNGNWLLSAEVPDVLEGAAPLFPGAEEAPGVPEEDQDPGSTAGSLSPVKVLEDSLRKIRVDYQDGRLSSEAARMISRRHYVIDLQGRFWTVGLQSGKWYRMESAGWASAGEPPSPDQLLKLEREKKCASCGRALEGSVLCPDCGSENPPELPDLPDEAYGRLLDFFLGDAPLPEDITEAWHPPEGFPDSLRDHFTPQGGKFCPHCGKPLG